MATIDLNADVGESYGRWVLGDDEHLLPHISSANVACGFHAGDPLTLRRTVTQCADLGVAVGAQVGYHDLAGFGRRAIDMESDALEADVLYQLAALDGLARAAGTRVSYLKPHGALYHRTLIDRNQASAVIDALIAYDPSLPVVTMSTGELVEVARDRGVAVIREGFADRGYGADGRLIPRGQPGALLTSADDIAKQAVVIAARDDVDSLCLHGDTPGAPEHAAAVRAALEAAGYEIRPHHAGS